MEVEGAIPAVEDGSEVGLAATRKSAYRGYDSGELAIKPAKAGAGKVVPFSPFFVLPLFDLFVVLGIFCSSAI